MSGTTTDPSGQAPPAPPPSSADIQRAQALLSSVASLLDSRSGGKDATGDGGAGAATSPPPGPPSSNATFPGLTEILPHLLAPLNDLKRRGSNGVNATSQQPSSSSSPMTMGTYRPLIMQVENVLSQLVSSLQDPTTPLPPAPGGALNASQSVRIAERVLGEQRGGGGGAVGKRPTGQERRDAILEARRKRRRLREGGGGNDENEGGTGQTQVGDGTRRDVADDGVPRRLVFQLPASARDDGGDDGGDGDNANDVNPSPSSSPPPPPSSQLHRIAASIRKRLQSTLAFCTALDRDAPVAAAASTSAARISTGTATTTPSSSSSPRVWLSELVSDDGDATDGRIAHGTIGVRLPGVAEGRIYFDCLQRKRGDDGDVDVGVETSYSSSLWTTRVTRVNLRTPSEAQEDAKSTAATGTSKAHLPSSHALLRQLSARGGGKGEDGGDDNDNNDGVDNNNDEKASSDPLFALTPSLLYLLSLRTLFASSPAVPPDAAHVALQKQQEEQLGMATDDSRAAHGERVVLVGWWKNSTAGNGSDAARWAWCKRVRDDARGSDTGHWRAFAFP